MSQLRQNDSLIGKTQTTPTHQSKTGNLNSLFQLQNYPKEKEDNPDSFKGELSKMFKEELTSILCNPFKNRK